MDGTDTLRYYYAILLKRLEFTVMVAESAEEALRLMESTIPSLILTDIALPQMTGIDFIKTVKNSDRIKKVPIVVLADRDAAATKSPVLEWVASISLSNTLSRAISTGRFRPHSYPRRVLTFG